MRGKRRPTSAHRRRIHITDDLTQVLSALDGPFVLVGASWGGPVIRNLSARDEFDVCGLVLVDQTDEKPRTSSHPKPNGKSR